MCEASSTAPLTRQLSPDTSPQHAGPRLSRAISSSSRKSVRGICINSRPTSKLDIEPVIKDGNSDEIEGSAMTISTIADTLVSGTEDQITLALFETQQVLEVCREDAIQALVPVICERLVQQSPAIQISAAETLLIVVSSKIPTSLAKIISDAAFHVLRSSSDACVCELWGQTLVKTLPHVLWSPKELDEIIDKLETRHGTNGGTKSHAVSRQLTARILGSLSMCSNQEDVKKRIMYRAMSLANDKDVEVRGMVAESMSFIGASIDISVVENELWPVISKLVHDENARVHAASMRTLSFIASAHATRYLRSTLYRLLIPPILVKEFTEIRRAAEADQRTVDDDTYLVLEINSEIFGELLGSCWDHMPDDAIRKDAFKAFLAMTTCNGPIVRKYCAANLPTISQCFLKRHRVEMSSIVEFLSRDSEPETRYVLASGIHRIVKTLASRDTINNLFKAVLALLQDAHPLVRKSTIQHFEELIAQLSKHIGYNSVRKLEPIFQNLHLLSEGNWRTQELLSRQLLMAAPLVPPPSIRSNVLPLLFKLAEQSSYLVRKAAMAAVATCMRYIPDTTEREKEMASFREEWAQGAIYWMRIGFIDSAKAALVSYSRCLFRDTFASELLRLANDPVSNVRVRVALILPLVTSACHQMVEFRNALERLKKDSDKDVRDAIEGIDERITQILENRQERFEEDMKREEEEQELYSKHINAQREAFRRKGNLKRAKTMFMRKSGKVFPPSSSKNTIQTSNERNKNKENAFQNNQTDTAPFAKVGEAPIESSEVSGPSCLSPAFEKKGSRNRTRSKASVGNRNSLPPFSSRKSRPSPSPRSSLTSLLPEEQESEPLSIAPNTSNDPKSMKESKRLNAPPQRSRSFILRRS